MISLSSPLWKSRTQMQIDQNSKRLYVIGKDEGKMVDTVTSDSCKMMITKLAPFL